MEEKRPIIRNTGIQSVALLEWVQSSVPFVFHSPPGSTDQDFIRILRSGLEQPPAEADLLGYFDLCLASHFATVGSFVPTDVDLAIREKLWSFVHSESVLILMWERVLRFQKWDETGVSNRWVGEGDLKLSGHQGEWLTIAMGAYATAKRLGSSLLSEIREAIEAEVDREEEALHQLKAGFLGAPSSLSMKRYLSGVAAVAHNLGDLDRMILSFDLDDTDILKRRVYRLGHEDSRHPRSVFLDAGRVYQALIASENHRNFALRSPKGLRKSALFLLPFGLFLDEWGSIIVTSGVQAGILNESDLREIIEALVLGWKKLNPVSIYSVQGYSRALVGMTHALGGAHEVLNAVPPSIRKDLIESGLRTLMGIGKAEFERKIQTKLKVQLNSSSC